MMKKYLKMLWTMKRFTSWSQNLRLTGEHPLKRAAPQGLSDGRPSDAAKERERECVCVLFERKERLKRSKLF